MVLKGSGSFPFLPCQKTPKTSRNISITSPVLFIDNLIFRFYYADERREDGKPAAESVSGTAHGKMYWELANEGKQSKWLVTFTKERGRHDFSGIDYQGKNRWGEQL